MDDIFADVIEVFPEPSCGKAKRRYRISAVGVALKRAAIVRTKPWLKSTGPTTVPGKKTSSQNHLLHGLYTAEFAGERLVLWRAMGEIRRAGSPGRGRKKPPPEPQLEPRVS